MCRMMFFFLQGFITGLQFRFDFVIVFLKQFAIIKYLDLCFYWKIKLESFFAFFHLLDWKIPKNL